ncbi:unnamed protein product [Prunus armeniaca]
MAAYTTFKLFLLTTLLALTMPFLATSAQPLNPNLIQLNSNLVARLNLGEESSNWFIAKENDVLKGYCDEANHVKSPPANPPSPPSIHDPINVKVVPNLEKLVP